MKQAPSKLPVWKASPANGKFYINSVAISGDGSRVVGGTFFHTYGGTSSPRRHSPPPSTPPQTNTFGTYCYDRSGTLLWQNEFSASFGVYWVAISADGSRAASGGQISSQAGFVSAFDATTGRQLLSHATQKRVNQVALSQDGQWLVSVAESLILFRYDSGTGTYVRSDEFTPNLSAYHGGIMNAVVSTGLSADGSTLVYSDYAGHVGVLSNSSGKLTLRQQWQVPSSFCHMLALTPDGRAFAAGGAAGCFHLCDTARFIAEGKPTYTYDTKLPDPVYSVAVSTDGQVFVGVVNNGPDAGRVFVVGIVDFATQLLCSFDTARNPNCASLNLPAGILAVADGHPDGTPGDFYLYDGITGTGLPIIAPALRWQYRTGNMSWPIAISADASAIAAGSDDSYIYYFTP